MFSKALAEPMSHVADSQQFRCGMMTENKILSFEPASRLHERRRPMQQRFDHPQHAARW